MAPHRPRVSAVTITALLLTLGLAAAAFGQSVGSAAAADTGFFSDLLRVYTPRRLCMNSEPEVIWLHVASDLLIAASYFSIPFALLVFIRRRRDIVFNGMFRLFAVFIFACGITHLVGVWAIWQPMYRVDGLIKLFTGVVSAGTAVLLWRLIPSAVALPSPKILAEANAELSRLRDDLERRVEDRTRALAEANDREREARTEAERANRAKDEFVATLAHELRTPLSAIVGWTEVLSNGDVSADQRLKGVDVIARNARVQSQLLEDLLDTSRIVSGKLRLDVRETDLVGVIEAALETVEPAARAKDIRLHKDLDPRAGLVIGDPGRLQQVMWNLLSNAVKFTPHGGSIRVALRRDDARITIRVSDTGRGIAPALLPHIFDRFRQDDSTATRSRSGLGLGLAIVRHLVELHGGTVEASSGGDSAGSAFVVQLPVTEHQDGRGAASPIGGGHAPESGDAVAGLLAGVKVLCVDDEPDARQLVTIQLQRAGAEVRAAASASEALQLLPRFRPHVLVSDLGMPGEDGLSLARKLRRLPAEAGGDTPAVALTAFTRADDRRDALTAGFQIYLSKPAAPAELILTVASLAGRKGDAHPGDHN